ncbi:TRM44 methyltransferase, partial [Amia calva]|nr:TRM44 methyltransferase [Amia calva]
MSKLSEIQFKGNCVAVPEGFWSAIDVWLKKPNVVNKRLCGSKEEESKVVEAADIEHILSAFWKEDVEDLKDVIYYLNNGLEGNNQHHTTNGGLSFAIRSIIPKVHLTETHFKEITLKDISSHRVTFLPLEENAERHLVIKKSNIYQIQLQSVNCEEWSISISTLSSESWFSNGVIYPKLAWLSTELLPKLVKWSTENTKSEFKSTLSLIPVEKYSHLYQKLKEKYKEMVKVWPEVTDPEKFVYEDVAIATYLLVLWEEERAEKGLTEKQSFVDLGCGNGLLVHILSNEGHSGSGIDVRKRKIWDMYGPQTNLKECTITPSDSFLFPETDWLIGNHSDELTPWIPVISARHVISSSYCSRFFVLPCCFFDFYGKYNRQHCKKSQYKEYIDFIAEVSHVCGFEVEEDCLRIPSTKRVCLIGKSRSYDSSREAMVDDQRTQYIKKRQWSTIANVSSKRETSSTEPTEGFQPRSKIEPMRNCATLPRTLIDKVVLQVANALLLLKIDDKHTPSDEKTWNRGGSLSVKEVAELLDKETLQNLKNECGGLQTLLKNSHQVFKVEGGRVQIRDWRVETIRRKPRLDHKRKPSAEMLKTRMCWFHTNHPEGCPLSSDSCSFAHGPEDLRHFSFKSKKQKSA